jgi:riboflavin biosynthesis pyrimidine reductase
VARLILFMAPVLLGEEAVPAFPVDTTPGAWRERSGWRPVGTTVVGRDVLIVWDREFSDP